MFTYRIFIIFWRNLSIKNSDILFSEKELLMSLDGMNIYFFFNLVIYKKIEFSYYFEYEKIYMVFM